MDGKIVAQRAAEMLGDTILNSVIGAIGYNVFDPMLNLLAIAFRDAVAELSLSFPVHVKSTATATDGVIPYSAVHDGEATVIDRVKRNGRDVPFTVDSFGIHVKRDGEYEVTYTPENFDVGLTDDVTFAPEVGCAMVTYLTVRNFCIVSGRVEEAAIYDSKYRDAAERIRLKRRAHMPARKFV